MEVRADAAPVPEIRGLEKLRLLRELAARRWGKSRAADEEAVLRSLFEQRIAGVYVLDLGGAFAYVNARLAELGGYVPGEMVGRPFTDFVMEADIDGVVDELAPVIAGEVETVQIGGRFKRRDGTPLEVLTQSTLATYAGRAAIIGVAIDISERRRADRSLERLNRLLKTIGAANEALMRARSEPELLRDLCNVAVESGNYAMAWIGLAQRDEAKSVRPVACAGIGTPYLDVAKVTWSEGELGRGPTGSAIRSGHPVINDDLTVNPAMAPWRGAALEHGFLSSIAIPLGNDGGIFGALTLYSAEAGAFSDDEVALLVELGRDIAYGRDALRTRRTKEVLAAVNSAIVGIDDRDALLAETCNIVFEKGGYAAVFIVGTDFETGRKIVRAQRGIWEAPNMWGQLEARINNPYDDASLVQRAFRSGQSEVINNIEDPSNYSASRQGLAELGIFSAGCFPLLFDGAVTEAMVIASYEQDNFNDDEIAMLSDLAKNISLSFEHFAKRQQLERVNRFREILSSVSAAIVNATEPATLAQEACRIAVEVGRFANVGIFLVGEDAGLEVLAHAGEWTRDEFATRLQRAAREEAHAGAPVQEVIRTRRPSIMRDVEDLRVPAESRARMRGLRVKGIAALPLIVEDRLDGIFVFQSRDVLDGEECRLLEEIAGNLAHGLGALRREQRVVRLNRIRNVLSAVNEAIVRVRDGDQLLEEACDVAFNAGGFLSVYAFVFEEPGHRASVRALRGNWSGHRNHLDRILSEVRGHPAESPGLTQATNQLRPFIVNDVSACDEIPIDQLRHFGVKSSGGFPLVIDGREVGMMIFDSDVVGYFDGEEIELLASLSKNISFALEHIAKERRVARLSRMRDMLSAVNAAIVRIRERKELYQEACRIAHEVGGFENVLIVEADLAERRAELQALVGSMDPEETQQSLTATLELDREGIMERSMAGRGPVLSGPLSGTTERPMFAALRDRGVLQVGSFPLVAGDKAVGAMLFQVGEVDFFGDEETALLGTLAGNLSFGLDLIEKQSRVDYLSYYDPLTGLPNRTLFYERLREQLSGARRSGGMLALALIDIVDFSAVNISLGEHGGDEILRQIANRLRQTVEESSLARVAGDRFVISLPLAEDVLDISTLVTDEGVEILNEPFRVGERELHLRGRVGCSIYPNDGSSAERLLQNAEAALQRAKAAQVPYRFYAHDLDARLAKRLDVESRLQRAIDQQEFVLHYQPKVEVATRKVVGFEALLRWPGAGDDLIQPADFVPLLEKTGAIVPVGRWVMAQAARQYEEWKAAGLRPPPIAVNLSAAQLRSERIVDDVRSVIATFSGECGLDLEITESMLMENLQEAIEKLVAIRELGVNIALDDFGTGYSSLAYLHRLPLVALKIDRSFISGMTDDVGKTSIVSTIVSLGEVLKLKVIAEGVEREDEGRLLQLLRCDQVQGYLYGSPEPAEIARKFLTR